MRLNPINQKVIINDVELNIKIKKEEIILNLVLEKANRLEGVLRNFLHCDYTEFGVKANGHLDDNDWKSPINFALGYKYALSPKMKEEIDYFLGNVLIGNSIGEIVKNYEWYGFNSKSETFKKIDDIIEELEKILNS